MNLRKEAKDKPCQVRIPGVCNGNPETTVLAHLPMAGISGMGMKPPDIIGTWACSSCHDEIDDRTNHSGFDQWQIDEYAYDGLRRTLYELCQLGYVMVHKDDVL